MSQWIRRKGVQLAAPYEEKRLAKWKPPWVIQPKLNGERGRAVFDSEGNLILYSSEENIVTGIPHINIELEATGLRNCELDGEFYLHGMPFSEIHSIVSRGKENLREDYMDMEYWLFDIPDVNVTQDKRLFNLTYVFDEYLNKASHIRRVPGYIIETVEEVNELLEIFHYQQKFEGFILRNLQASYHRGRTVNMMKFKPSRDDIYEIIDSVEAVNLTTGKPKGMLGSFVCKSNDITETFHVGAGRLDHPERTQLWKIKDMLPGNRLHVAYQHLTSKRGVPRNGVALEVLWGGIGK